MKEGGEVEVEEAITTWSLMMIIGTKFTKFWSFWSVTDLILNLFGYIIQFVSLAVWLLFMSMTFIIARITNKYHPYVVICITCFVLVIELG